MKRIVFILVVALIAVWSAIHWNDLDRRVQSVFDYAADNPGTFWTIAGVVGALIAVSVIRAKR